MSMTVPEARAEIRSLYEKAKAIEDRYPAGLTDEDNHEDFNEVKRLLGEIDGLEDKLGGLEEADERKRRIIENQKTFSKPTQGHQQPESTPAPTHGGRVVKAFWEQFVQSEEYDRALKSGIFNSRNLIPHLDVKLDGSLLDYLARKALVYSGTGSAGPTIQNDRLGQVLPYLNREITLLDFIPTASTTSNMIEYAEETAFTNSAAEVAEATATTGTTGTKAESGLTYAIRTSPVSTIAHWIPVTNSMLADTPAIEGIIRARLMLGLNLRLETEVINGDGNSPNLRGILNTTNVQTLGVSAGTSIGGQATVVDAAYAAMNQVMVTGLANPSGFVFHPNDWAAVRLSRENAATGTLGQYLYGPPSVQGPQVLWGRPVALALGMVENTMLTGDFAMGCMLFDREDAAIRVGTINDQFIRNMQTILAEMRAAFVVFRPTAFARVTGV